MTDSRDNGDSQGVPAPAARNTEPGFVACATHDGEAATSRCLICATPLCGPCTVAVRGSTYCAAHAAQAREAPRSARPPVVWSTADLADLWTRALGYGVDAVLLGVLGTATASYILMVIPVQSLASYYMIVAIAFSLLLGVYCTLLVGGVGRTLGHSLFGLRVVRTDGGAVSYWRAFLRWIGYLLCTVTAFVGFALAIWDRRRQGLHDKLADTVVLGARMSVAGKIWASVALVAAIYLGLRALSWLFGSG